MKFGSFWKSWCLPAISLLFGAGFLLSAQAQYVAPYVAVTGVLSSSNGIPAPNYTLSFVPTQTFFIAATSVVVTGSQCATDVSGQVVGVPNPQQGPVVSVTYTGTLPLGNYWIAITWYDTYGHETLPSPVVASQLSVTAGRLVISPPVSGAPINAIGMRVYIGATSSSLQFQGQTTAPTSTFIQSVPLATGGTPPIMNGTVCQVVANDAGWPTGTGYQTTITDSVGNTLPGYPQQWQFLGPGSTYNLSNGIPLYNGRVIYPVPLLTQPYNHNLQSISGPLSMGTPGGIGYNIINVNEIGVGTALPAWGVDVEGAGLAGLINSIGGYLYNGTAPNGQCLVGNGNAFVPGNCLGGLSVFYQTVRNASGTAQTQEPSLQFTARFGLTTTAPSTIVDLATTGVAAGTYTNPTTQVDVYGRVLSISNGFLQTQQEDVTITSGICTTSGASYGTCTFPISGNILWPTAFADTNYSLTCLANQAISGKVVLVNWVSKSAAGFRLQLQNGTSDGAMPSTVSEIDCHGSHL